MFEYFYHSITKKAVVAFGSLFNDIHIARYNSNGTERERVKVPLSYMTKQKFISRLTQNPELTNDLYMSLPRMAFEFSTFIYDSSRKNDSMQRVFSGSNNSYSFRYGRVPYNVTFMLHAFAKNTDDCLQILEQILPWFTPEYSVNVKMVNPTDMSVDVPFVIQNVTYDEDVEDSNFDGRKTVTMTIEFISKLFYYSPTSKLSLGATSASGGYDGGTAGGGGFGPGVVIPQGMIGKVVTSSYELDSNFSFSTLEMGLTGNVNPINFSSTGTDQTYIVWSRIS